MASPALQALGIGNLPGLGDRYQKAVTTDAAATTKMADSLKAKETALAPIETSIKEANAKSPAAPKLDSLPAKFQHQGLDPQQMTDAVQTMFAFAAIGGAMTRTPMTAALSAFSKGIEGLVKGDQMVFQREKDEFDRHLKTALAKNQQAIDEYRMAAEKHKGDLNGMMTEWRLIAAKHQDTVAMAQFESQNAKGAMQHIENLVKMDEQARRMDQQFSLQMKRIDEQIRAHKANEAIAQGRNIIKEKALAQGGKPSQTDRQHYMDSNALVKSADRIEAMLSNPTIRQKIDDSRVANFMSDAVETKAIQQFLVRPNLDPDVKKYLAEVANLRNQYYLDMSGKAVTGGEALRNYGAVMQPGDTAEDVLNKMGIARTRANERMRDLDIYFPTLGAIRARPGGGGGGAGPAPVNDKGWKLMEDASGKKAYVGPNNEIEEVSVGL